MILQSLHRVPWNSNRLQKHRYDTQIQICTNVVPDDHWVCCPKFNKGFNKKKNYDNNDQCCTVIFCIKHQ